jgi:hypothetical protein
MKNEPCGRSHDIAADRSPEIATLYAFRRRIILDIPNIGTDRKGDLFEVLVFLDNVLQCLLSRLFHNRLHLI